MFRKQPIIKVVVKLYSQGHRVSELLRSILSPEGSSNILAAEHHHQVDQIVFKFSSTNILKLSVTLPVSQFQPSLDVPPEPKLSQNSTEHWTQSLSSPGSRHSFPLLPTARISFPGHLHFCCTWVGNPALFKHLLLD